MMNEQIVTAMLEQNTSAIKTFVQLMFDSLKQEIGRLRDENSDLKRSLEFSQSEIDSLKELQPDVHSMQNTFEQASSDLLNRVRSLEDQGKKKNIRITGLPENGSENSEQTQEKVQKLITDTLKLNNVKVKSAFRAGSSMQNNSQPRPIIVKVSSVNEKISCFKASKALKGTNTYISEDVSKATMDIRKQKLGALKEKREQGYIAYFSGIDIITKKRNVPNHLNPATGANSVPVIYESPINEPSTSFHVPAPQTNVPSANTVITVGTTAKNSASGIFKASKGASGKSTGTKVASALDGTTTRQQNKNKKAHQ